MTNPAGTTNVSSRRKHVFRLALLLLAVSQLWFGFDVANLACGSEQHVSVPAIPNTALPTDNLGNNILTFPGTTITTTTPTTPTPVTVTVAKEEQNGYPNAVVIKRSYDQLEVVLQKSQATNKNKEIGFDMNAVRKLCYVGELRDLNQVMQVVERLLFLGQQLKRTVVLPPYFTALYDMYLMDTTDMESGTVVEVSRNQMLCDPRQRTPNVPQWHHKGDKPKVTTAEQWLAAMFSRPDDILFVGGHELSLYGHDLFSPSNDQTGEQEIDEEEEKEGEIRDSEDMISQLLISHLYPYKETREQVFEFVAKYFGDESFVALHLDVCESSPEERVYSGYNRHLQTASKFLHGVADTVVGWARGGGQQTTQITCVETDIEMLQWVLEKQAPKLVDAPVFVSVSPEFREMYPELVDQFVADKPNTEANEEGSASTSFVFFNDACPRRYECDMINREIAAHSAFFYSSRLSGTSQHIEGLRRWRNNKQQKILLSGLIKSFSIQEAKAGGYVPHPINSSKYTSKRNSKSKIKSKLTESEKVAWNAARDSSGNSFARITALAGLSSSRTIGATIHKHNALPTPDRRRLVTSPDLLKQLDKLKTLNFIIDHKPVNNKKTLIKNPWEELKIFNDENEGDLHWEDEEVPNAHSLDSPADDNAIELSVRNKFGFTNTPATKQEQQNPIHPEQQQQQQYEEKDEEEQRPVGSYVPNSNWLRGLFGRGQNPNIRKMSALPKPNALNNNNNNNIDPIRHATALPAINNVHVARKAGLFAKKTRVSYPEYLKNLEESRPYIPPEVIFPPNGVICQLGTFEQLNNVLDQVAAMLHIGYNLNRTVVIPPLISEVYDTNFLELDRPFPRRLNPADGSFYYPTRTTTNQSLCDPENGWHFSHVIKGENVMQFEARHSHVRAPVLVMGARDWFEFGFEYRTLFQYLHPYKETREIVVNFIQQHFGVLPFVAVHLRFLDGKCYTISDDDVACDLDPDLVNHLVRRRRRYKDAKIFVASDHQRPDLELLYAQAGNAVFYRGKCHSYDKQCMVIDAEIAARSVIFYGLVSSTASQNIQHFRIQRVNGTPYKQFYSFNLGKRRPKGWVRKRWGGGSSRPRIGTRGGVRDPHKNNGADAAKFFAERPREAMDLRAATVAPTSFNTLNYMSESSPQQNFPPGHREFVLVKVSTKCRDRVDVWAGPLLWLVVGVAIAYEGFSSRWLRRKMSGVAINTISKAKTSISESNGVDSRAVKGSRAGGLMRVSLRERGISPRANGAGKNRTSDNDELQVKVQANTGDKSD